MLRYLRIIQPRSGVESLHSFYIRVDVQQTKIPYNIQTNETHTVHSHFLCNQIGMAHVSHLFDLYHNVNKNESPEVWEWYGRLMGRGSHYWGSLEKSSSHRPGSGTGIRSGAPSLHVDLLRMDGWTDGWIWESFQHNESGKTWQLSVFRRIGSWRYNTFNTFRSIFATNVGL